MVGTRDDLVARLQAGDNFNIGGAADAGFDLAEFGFIVLADEEDALDFFLHFLGLDRVNVFSGSRRRLGLVGGGFQISLGAGGQGLNRDRRRAFLGGGRDFRRATEARADFFGSVIDSDHYLEILGFLAGSVALRSGETGGAEDGRVADLDHVALEGLAGDGVDGNFRRLVELYVHDVGLVDFYLGRDD